MLKKEFDFFFMIQKINKKLMQEKIEKLVSQRKTHEMDIKMLLCKTRHQSLKALQVLCKK